jgi:unsaturated rhamnogalacturonyl hydrolase
MWLDGIYMGSAFLAQYAKVMNESDLFDDVVCQIELIEKHTRDPKAGLMYHGWDESKQQQWANPQTDCSPHFWGRAMGWFAMALVDILDYLPTDHPKRNNLLDIFKQTIDALLNVQDDASGLWYQVLNMGEHPGNYLEASASCMITYSIAKAIRLSYINHDYRKAVDNAHAGIRKHLVEIDDEGMVNLNNICGVAGLGGNSYRDGSYEYYVGEPKVTNDYKGVGPFIMAMVEHECLSSDNHK